MSASSDSDLAIRQFQSEVDALRAAPEPRAARMAVFLLTSLLLAGIAIMCLTSVDRVIVGTGKIVPTARINVFQALDRSLIKTIDVREGDQVASGQLLATLDSTFAAADVLQLTQQIASLEALIARDEAELAGREPAFAKAADPDRLRYQSLQRAYYDQRMAQYNSQLEGFDAKIAQTKASIHKLKSDQDRYAQRENIAKQIEGMRTTLAQSGSGSQLNMLISQDARIEVVRAMESTQNSLLEAQHALSSIQADRETFRRQWSAALSQELVSARNTLDSAKAQLEKADKRNELVRLTALEPSVVLTVAKLSVGSVLKEGDPLFTLMPLDTPMEAEARIASRDIGFVRVGDRCSLKVDAFDFLQHGSAEGTVRWISEGAFTTEDSGQPVEAYYKLRCSIERTRFVNVPANFRLIPGMTLTADVNVGTRSVAMYLLHGLLRGFAESMREP